MNLDGRQCQVAAGSCRMVLVSEDVRGWQVVSNQTGKTPEGVAAENILALTVVERKTE